MKFIKDKAASRAANRIAKFENQTVWITGASSGIGAALAQQFASQGARIILSARRKEQLEQVRQQLPQPERHLVQPLDITDEQAVTHTVTQLFNQVGQIDLLINNAGLSQRALIRDTTMAVERQLMEIDYFAQIHLTKQVLPYLERQGHGQLVFVSSVAGLLGTQYRASYSAAKAALHLWANACRAEYSQHGLRVAVVFPGFVNTDVAINALSGDGRPQGYQDASTESGLSASAFAEKVVTALAAGEEYIVVGGLKEKLGDWLGRARPSLMYRMVRRATVR